MKPLNELSLFVETARQGSFSKAANRLGLTPAAISAAIKRLETQVGFPLFVRSTRSLRLTGEGEIFLEKATQALSLIREGLEQITSARGELVGKLHLAAPSDFGRNLLLCWVEEFTATHPNITINIELSDSLADMYSSSVDIAIRYGEPAESSMIAIPLCKDNIRVLCSGAGYLASHQAPEMPEDLNQHNCLFYRLSDRPHNHWVLTRNGETKDDVVEMVVSGNACANDGDLIRRMAVNNRGIV